MTDAQKKMKKVDEVCKELDAMKAIVQVLDGLDPDSVKRVLEWVWKTYVLDPLIEKMDIRVKPVQDPAPVDPVGPWRPPPWWPRNPWSEPYRPEVVAYAAYMDGVTWKGPQESVGSYIVGDPPESSTTTAMVGDPKARAGSTVTMVDPTECILPSTRVDIVKSPRRPRK